MPRRVALLLSAESFEQFFSGQLGLDRAGYVASYRNDWAWDYVEALRGQGIDAAIYVATEGAAERVMSPDGVLVRFLPLGRAWTPWRVAPVLKRSPPARWVSQLVAGLALERPLRAALARDGADVLLVQEYWTGRFDTLALRLGRPLLAIDQGMPDRREVKLLKRWSLPRAAAVVVQTRPEAAKVARYGGRPERLPNGVDTERFSPAGPDTPRDPATILTVGRLHDGQKRQSDLLRALARLPEPWRVTLLGSGPDEARLRALAADLGVADRVEFAGFEPDRDRIRERLRACTVFALPSSFEGLPMALLEAMACGAPVVGSDIPAIAEVLEDGAWGLTVPVSAPDKLADAIAAAGRDRDRLGARARERVEAAYSQQRLGAELARLVGYADHAEPGTSPCLTHTPVRERTTNR